jgi:hypothetical protein
MLLLPELRENLRKNSKMIGLNGNALIQSIGYQNALRIEQGGEQGAELPL